MGQRVRSLIHLPQSEAFFVKGGNLSIAIGILLQQQIVFENRLFVFLARLLPDPASLGPRTRGKTCIGCIVRGTKDGQEKQMYLYNICDHQACYAEVQSQAISYTTGVPAMIGAKMILEGHWRRPGVWNVEQCDPDPFMADMNRYGLPWKVVELDPGFRLDVVKGQEL